MPGFPDWQKGSAWTFPADLSTVEANTTTLTVTTNQTTTIKAYTDGKVHVLYELALRGTVRASTTTDIVRDYEVALSRGLSNNNVQTEIYRRVFAMKSDSSLSNLDVLPFSDVIPVPLMFVAGSIGTPNNLNLILAGEGSSQDNIAISYISWPIT